MRRAGAVARVERSETRKGLATDGLLPDFACAQSRLRGSRAGVVTQLQPLSTERRLMMSGGGAVEAAEHDALQSRCAGERPRYGRDCNPGGAIGRKTVDPRRDRRKCDR